VLLLITREDTKIIFNLNREKVNVNSKGSSKNQQFKRQKTKLKTDRQKEQQQKR